MRQLSLPDQVYRPVATERAPFQSVEGLALGVDLSVRYALDPVRIGAMVPTLPPDINGAVVEPAVRGVIYKVFTRYRLLSTRKARR